MPDMVLPSTGIGGEAFAQIPFGDIVPYLTPFTASLFGFTLIFTLIAVFSRHEKQVNIIFGDDACYTRAIEGVDLKFQKFMAIACGLATFGVSVTGDLFNFILFSSMIGITNIGIVAAYRNTHVRNAAYQFGILAMLANIPLFGSAAITASTTGTLSLWELYSAAISVPLIAKAFLMLGVVGEGMAPFYVAKAEITRAPGAPYVLMITISSLILFLRAIEIIISV